MCLLYNAHMDIKSEVETDEALAIRVQGGDKAAFAVLMERYEGRLLRYGNKFLTEREDVVDIVQEVFISVYQNIKSFDEAQKFSPWIYRIAHNAFVNGLKKKSRNPFVMLDFDALLSHTVSEDPLQGEREQEEIQKMIDAGLDQLSAKYKEILILHYLEEMSYREIADILEVPIGTVGIRIKRAKEGLKKVYEKMQFKYGET